MIQTFFYATVIGGPALLYGVYLTSRLGASDGSQKPYLTSLIEIYEGWKDEYARRNDSHVKMIQQAAEDRNLFLNSDEGNRYVDLKFPEYVRPACSELIAALNVSTSEISCR